MAPKMVSSFKRSLSFPNPPSSSSKLVAPKKNFHVRSTSLPCTSHPLIYQLKRQITDLKACDWAVNPRTDEDTAISSGFFLGLGSRLCEGLSRLRTLHESLDDLLHLPPSRDSLGGRSEWVENVLEDFLRLVDVYGIFQTQMLTLRQDQLAAQLAIRRGDHSKVVLGMKNLRKTAKEMGRLASTVRPIGLALVPSVLGCDNSELPGVIIDVIEVTVSVSVALFEGISGLFLTRKSSWMKRVWGSRSARKGDTEKGEKISTVALAKKMEEMEECMEKIEIGSERVFRSLINARVSLLNVYTQ